MTKEISLSDYIGIHNIAHEWSESCDLKDWERLRKCLAPSIRLDFRSVRGPIHENLTPEECTTIMSDKHQLGDPRLKTQHLLGGERFEVLSDGLVYVSHQIRVAYQRYESEHLTEVVNKGHAHGTVQHWYRKIDGIWKLEGVEPRLEWFEYDLFGTLTPPEDMESKS